MAGPPAGQTPLPSAAASDLLVRWLAQLSAVRQRSPKTVEAYRRDVAGYLGFLASHQGGPMGGKGEVLPAQQG